MCNMLPAPDDAKLNPPGLDFASAMSSLTLVMGSVGDAHTMYGLDVSLATGRRSRTGLYPSGRAAALVTTVLLLTSNV